MQKQIMVLVLGNNERDERTATYRKYGEQKQQLLLLMSLFQC